jgi:large subunit ribosomal protein L31e
MADKKIQTSEKLEREYVIPLREKLRVAPRYKKASKAIRTVKEFLLRHMKLYDGKLEDVKVDKYLNEAIWARGIKHPPHKIKVKAIKEGNIVRAELAEFPSALKFKKEREERAEKKAEEVVKGKKKALEKVQESIKKEEKTPEEKKEEKEKKETSAEATMNLERQTAKQAKHQTKQNANLPKHQRRMALEK